MNRHHPHRYALTILISIQFSSIGCAFQKVFSCPLENGSFLTEIPDPLDNEQNRWPGAEVNGPNREVLSVLSGFVERVYTIQDVRIVVVIANDKYSFTYFDILDVAVSKGDRLQKGQKIGYLKKGERLFVLSRKKGELIEPESVINCRD